MTAEFIMVISTYNFFLACMGIGLIIGGAISKKPISSMMGNVLFVLVSLVGFGSSVHADDMFWMVMYFLMGFYCFNRVTFWYDVHKSMKRFNEELGAIKDDKDDPERE